MGGEERGVLPPIGESLDPPMCIEAFEICLYHSRSLIANFLLSVSVHEYSGWFPVTHDIRVLINQMLLPTLGTHSCAVSYREREKFIKATWDTQHSHNKLNVTCGRLPVLEKANAQLVYT